MKVRKLNNGSFMIWCPACKHAHVFDSRWVFNGDFEKPSFTSPTPGGPSSMRVTGYLNKEQPNGVCHSHVTDGQIIFCGDCTHALNGQTLPLEDF